MMGLVREQGCLQKEEQSLRIKGKFSQKEDNNNNHKAQGNLRKKGRFLLFVVVVAIVIFVF